MIEKVAIGSETHGRPSFYVYMNEKVYEKWKNKTRVYGDPEIKIIENLRLLKVEDKIVAKEEEGYYVVRVLYESGFRGQSEIEVVEASEGVGMFPFWEYASERGGIGISQGLLVSMPPWAKLRLYGKRSGRTYGKDKEFKIVIETQNGVSVKEDLPEELIRLLEG